MISSRYLAFFILSPLLARSQPEPDKEDAGLGTYLYAPEMLRARDLPSPDATDPIVVGNLLDMPPPPAKKPDEDDDGDPLPPSRLELRRLKANTYQWNLYILGLSMLQWANQSDQESWYQLAGIHGLPYVSWNGVEAIPGSNGTGYCTHISNLFSTWHRPYLALFEQILYDRVNRIASWFPDPEERETYQEAASTFRLPYWDWAVTPQLGQKVFPDDLANSSIYIYGPAGWQLIANPLYSYRFRPIDPTAFIHLGLNVWNQTLRAPTNLTSADAVSQNSVVAATVDQAQPVFQQRLYNLLSNYPKFNAFSTKRWGAFTNETAGTYDSCESLHDAIHMAVGQKGHFQYIAYSAFDPVFFLHHTMVDRIVAMWQVLYPGSWIEPMPAAEATFTTAKAEIQDSKTPLTPFRSDPGAFWTSDASRNLTVFGYTYDDLHMDARDPAEQRERVAETVNALYGGSSPPGLVAAASGRRWRNRGRDPEAELAARSVDWADAPDLSRHLVTPTPPKSALVRDNHYTEWQANIRVRSGVLDGSFSVFFFVGRVPGDPDAFTTAPNLAGTASVFAMASRPGVRLNNHEISTVVPLTAALVRLVSVGRLPSLDPAEVIPFLRSHLRYRIVDRTGQVVENRPRLRLSIAIASATVRAPSSPRELPKWGPQVTRYQMAGKRSS